MMSENQEFIKKVIKSIPKNNKLITDADIITMDAYRKYKKREKEAIQKINKTITDAYINGKKIVFIYQMGKVGSTSYASSLNHYENLQIFHLHRMVPISNFQMIGIYLYQNRVDNALRERTWMELYDKIILEQRPVYIITAVRDPISRNISAFFNNYSFDDNTNIKDRTDTFIRKHLHSIPIKWFDDEIKKTLKINVFNYSFDVERGYDQIIHDNINMLIMRSELKNTIKEEAIKNFLNLIFFKIDNKNITAQEKNHRIYNDFKRKIELSPKYIEEMLNNEMVNHFYSQEMIHQIREQWSRGEKKN